MKTGKKILSCFLALIMLLGMFPVSAFATEPEVPQEVTIEETGSLVLNEDGTIDGIVMNSESQEEPSNVVALTDGGVLSAEEVASASDNGNDTNNSAVQNTVASQAVAETPAEDTDQETQNEVEQVPNLTASLEDVDAVEGSTFSVSAKAENYTNVEWRFIKEEETISIKEMKERFQGVGISSAKADGKEMLTVTNACKEIDGWQIKCIFSNDNGNSVETVANLTITAKVVAEPVTDDSNNTQNESGNGEGITDNQENPSEEDASIVNAGPTEKQEEASEGDGIGDKEAESNNSGETTTANTEYPAFSGKAIVGDVCISVIAAEGVFPAGATLVASAVTSDEMTVAEEAVGTQRDEKQNLAASYTFDIKIVDTEGNEVQPLDGAKVHVSFSMDKVKDRNLTTQVYHLEEKDGELEAEKLESESKGETVVAKTDGFSWYTVDFTYDEMEYSIGGDTTVPLSEVLEAVGLVGDVSNAESSAPELFSVQLENGIWMLTALQAFTSSETLTVVINDVTYIITVTDDTTYTEDTRRQYMMQNSYDGSGQSAGGIVGWFPYSTITGDSLRGLTFQAVNCHWLVAGSTQFPAYCLQPNKAAGMSYTETSSAYPWSSWSASVKEMASKALYWGYPNYTESGVDALVQQAALQAMMFDIACGFVTVSGGSYVRTGKSKKISSTETWTTYGFADATYGVATAAVRSAYTRLLTRMNQATPTIDVPSYATEDGSTFNYLDLTYNPSTGLYEGTWTDTTGSASYFDFESSTDGLVITQSGDDITITATPAAVVSLGLNNTSNTTKFNLATSSEPNRTILPSRVQMYDGSSNTQRMARYIKASTDEVYVTAHLALKVSDFGYVRLEKSSSNTAVTNGNSNYSLAGAVYGFYSDSACTNLIETATTDANGVLATTHKYATGTTYYVKELTAPSGYELDTTIHSFTGSLSTIELEDTPMLGSIQITKTSSDPSATNGNSAFHYDAVYGLYSDAECTDLLQQITLTQGTNNGTGTFANLPLGTYYVKEISAPIGFVLSTEVKTVQVASSAQTAVAVTETPGASLTIQKVSSNPSMTNDDDEFEFDAVYGIYSDSACTVLVQSVQLTDAGNYGYATINGLTCGTYYVKEITAPIGFALSADTSGAIDLTTAGASETVVMTDVPLGGSLTLVKTSSDTSVTSGNALYRYDATYGIYYDSACTQLITTVTLNNGNEQGTATVTPLPTDTTVYVKEITAPRGFELNMTVTPVYIHEEGENTSPLTWERGTLSDSTGEEVNNTWSTSGTLKATSTKANKPYTQVPYTITYDASTDTSTVTFGTSTQHLRGRRNYGYSITSTITVTSETSSSATATFNKSGTTTGSDQDVTGTPSPASVTVNHNGGTTARSLTITLSSTFSWVPYDNTTRQSSSSASASATVHSGDTRVRTESIALNAGTYQITDPSGDRASYAVYVYDLNGNYLPNESFTTWSGAGTSWTLNGKRLVRIAAKEINDGNIFTNTLNNVYLYYVGLPVSLTTVNLTDVPTNGVPITFAKTSASPAVTDGDDRYSLAGAVYGIYSDAACTALLEQMTTNASGTMTSSDTYAAGSTVYIKEITPSQGYQLDTRVHTVTIGSDGTLTTNTAFTETPYVYASIGLTKTSANTAITNGNALYSLSGAVYGIYSSSACTSASLLETITTDTSGATTSAEEYSAGTYYVKEITPSPGYKLDTATHALTVAADGTISGDTTFNEIPASDPSSMRIRKVTDNGATTITSSPAVFKVEYYKNNNWSGTPAATWYYQTINGITLIGNESYLFTEYDNSDRYTLNGNVVIPIGTVKITEVNAPSGYERSNAILRARISQDSTGADANWAWTTVANGVINYEAAGATFENEAATTSMTVSKTVTGNLGDRAKQFTFTLTLTNDGSPVSGTFSYSGSKSGSLTLNASGQATFTLGDSESITIADVPIGAAYTVVEDNYASSGYVTTYTNASGTLTANAVSVSITNTCSSVVPSGFDMNFMVVLTITLGSILFVILMNKKRERRLKRKEE